MDDNFRNSTKNYASTTSNVIPDQTFDSNSTSLIEPQTVTPEDMLRKVGFQEEALDGGYNERAAINARKKLFGRSILQLFAIGALMLLFLITAATAVVLTSKKSQTSGTTNSALLASLNGSSKRDGQLSQPDGATLTINRNTVLGPGYDFTATGDVLIQSQPNSAKAFRIQNAAGNNLLVANTLDNTVTINGALLAGSALISTSNAYSLSGQGLTIGGVLVCTSAGCVNNGTTDLDTSDLARLTANQTFSGINKFTSAGNVFAGDGSGLSALNASSVSTGTLSDSRLSGNVALLTADQTFSGNNTFSLQIQASAGINVNTGYSVGGTAGTNITCGPTELLQQGVIQGGIVTSGNCVTIAGGTIPSLQQVYDASIPASIVLSNASGVLQIQDAASPLATNLFEVTSNGGATKYFAVNNLGISVTGNVNTTGQYRIGGVQISSANLSNDANLAKLNANQTFSGNNTFSNNITANAGLTVTAGQTLTVNGDGFTDLTGNGLQLSSGSLTLQVVASADGLSSTTSSGSGLEVLAGGLSLLQGCGNGQILKWNETTDVWYCTDDAGSSGLGDDVFVNGSAATNANFIDTAVSGTTAGVAITLNTGPNPDTIALAVSNASITDAGVVTAGTQSFAGDKTFTGNLAQTGTGTFSTGTGTASLNGNTSVTGSNTFNVGTGTSTFAGGNISQTGSGTFSTGTGAVSLNGDTTVASGKNFTVTSGTSALSGTTNINISGSATTTIGALTSTDLVLQDAQWNVTGAGAATFASITNNGTYNTNTFTSSALAFGANSGATIDANGTNTISIGGTSTGNILLGGGSGSTGCTLTNSSGDFTCTGNITGAATGTAGYWSRSGATLQPATAGDAVTTSGNISTTGSGTITSAGLLTGSAGVTISGGTAQINASGTAATSIGNSTGVLTIASGGTSGWTNTAGNLTIQTATSGTLALDSAAAITLGGANATGITEGNTANTASWAVQGTAAATYTIGTSGNTGGITIGNSTDTNEIDIGNANTLDTKIQTIKIGAGTGVTTGKSVVTVGSTANASSLTLQAGSAGISLNGNTTISGSHTFATGTGAVSLQGDTTISSGKVLKFATAGGGTLTVQPTSSASNFTITFPAETGTVCTTASVCSGYAANGGTGLSKNAVDTSTAAVTAVQGNLYTFTNSSSAIASGVLKLDNGTNTNSTLTVTASGNPTSGKAVIFASNTNASPTGNLLDLQAGSSPASVFSVSSAGAISGISTSSTALTVASSGTNYGLQVDESTASAITGLKIKAAASGGGLALSTLGGTNEALTIDAKGTGTVTLASVSTGDIQFFSSSNKLTSGGNLTIAGTYNGNTFTSTALTFSGASPVISSSSTNSITLQTANVSTNSNGTTTGSITIKSGTESGASANTNSGNITIQTGDTNTSSVTTTIGNVTIDTGTNTINGGAGTIFIGTSANGAAVQIGNATSGVTAYIKSADANHHGVCKSGGSSGTGLLTLEACSTTATADYAELYPTESTVHQGDLVMPSGNYLTSKDGKYQLPVLKTTQTSYDRGIIGVISEQTMAENGDQGAIIGNNINSPDNPQALALNGRVMTKVNTENGNIAAGDYITASSTPGVGMKATHAGEVVGRALAAYSGSSVSQILIFVNPSYYNPDNNLQGDDGTFDLVTANSITVNTLTVNGTATFNGSIVVNGHIIGNSDTSGTVTLSAGTNSEVHTFTSSYYNAPNVVISPESDIGGLRYWVTKTAYDFTIHLSGNAGSDIKFDYFVQQ